jgi:hypothetical protein
MLRLVKIEEPKHGEIVRFDAADAEARAARAVRAEATILEMKHGKNAYSSFLLKHGRRPVPVEAATIGHLIGARVLASDGTMQPPISKAQEHAVAAEREKRRTAIRHQKQILRLRRAISGLASNQDDPSLLITSIAQELDGAAICEQLELAVSWLNRFAEEWRSRADELNRGIA